MKPPNVRTSDGRRGRTRPLPDDRVEIELEDGGTLVVEADRLVPQADGPYLVTLTPAETGSEPRDSHEAPARKEDV